MTVASLFRRKHECVEAMQYLGTNAGELLAWLDDEDAWVTRNGSNLDPLVRLTDWSGEVVVIHPSCWIVRRPEGGFVAMTAQRFNSMYEPA